MPYRYKASAAGLEAVAWYCDSCSRALWRHTFDTATTIPQRAYADACAAFNADSTRRTCGGCGRTHPPVEYPVERWAKIAAELAGVKPSA